MHTSMRSIVDISEGFEFFFTTLNHIDKTTKKLSLDDLKLERTEVLLLKIRAFEKVPRGKEGCLILHMEIEKKNSIIERKLNFGATTTTGYHLRLLPIFYFSSFLSI